MDLRKTFHQTIIRSSTERDSIVLLLEEFVRDRRFVGVRNEEVNDRQPIKIPGESPMCDGP